MLTKIGENSFWNKSITGVFKINWDKIKKGRSVGSKVSNHRRSPVLEASNAERGNNSK